MFYMEPLSRNGHDMGDFPDGGSANESFDKLSSIVVARAERAFQFISAEE